MRNFLVLLMLALSLRGAETHLRYSDEQKRWAMAMAAVPVETNGADHQLLSMFAGSERNVNAELGVLRSAYWIRSGKQLRAMIQELLQEGQRESFSQLVKLSPEAVEVWRDMHAPGTAKRFRIEDAVEFGPRFGERSIAAWDYGRAAYLCRSGYLTAMMSEEDAWTCLFTVAPLVQKSFRSWQEYGTNYMVGRRHWDATEPLAARADWAFRKLLTDGNSPWRILPWELDLTPGAASLDARPPVETSAHLQLASHPGGTTCFAIRVCDRSNMPSLLGRFAKTLGCSLQAVSEERERRDYTARGDCVSPHARTGRVSTTTLKLEDLYADLRKEGVTQLFVTWDHPQTEWSELTPMAHYRWVSGERSFEERGYYLDAAPREVRLSYGSPGAAKGFVAWWAWLALALALGVSAIAGRLRPPAERMARVHLAVQVIQMRVLSPIWWTWALGVITSEALPALTQALNLRLGAGVAALLLLCVPPILTYGCCLVLLGAFQRKAGSAMLPGEFFRLGLATAAWRGLWPAVAMLWFSGTDPVNGITILFTIAFIYPVDRFLAAIIQRLTIGPRTIPLTGPIRERALELAQKAKLKLKGVHLVPQSRIGWVQITGWPDGRVYLPRVAMDMLSRAEMDALLARAVLMLRGHMLGPVMVTVFSGLILGEFASVSRGRNAALMMLVLLTAAMSVGLAWFMIRQWLKIDVAAAELVQDPTAMVRAIRKNAAWDLEPAHWGMLTAFLVRQASTTARERAIAGLLPVADEPDAPRYEVPEPA